MTKSSSRREAESGKTGAELKFIASMIIFGTIGLFARHIPLPSSIVAFTRGIIGTLFLVLFVAVKKIKISRADIKKNLLILGLSGVCIGANWMLLFEAYRYTTVATATLCYYLAPVFVILVSPFFFKEKITLAKGLCVATALFGMVLVSGVLQGGLTGSNDLLGIVFGVGAALFYAGTIILNKHLKEISSYDRTIMQLGIAAIVLLPYIAVTEKLSEISFSLSTLAWLVTLGILHTGIGYALYFGSMKTLKAQTIALFSYIDPVIAIALSAFILKEEMGFMSFIGAFLVLGSTFFSERVENKSTA